MGRRQPLDPAGPAFTACPLIYRSIVATAIFILLCSLFSLSQQQPEITTFEQLAAQQRWQEIVRLAEGVPDPSATVEYYHGLALARLERWDEAHRVLLAGSRKNPGDKRFPEELAGVDF